MRSNNLIGYLSGVERYYKPDYLVYFEINSDNKIEILCWDIEKEFVIYEFNYPDKVWNEFKFFIKNSISSFHDFIIGYLSYEANLLIEPYLIDYLSYDLSWPLIHFIKPRYYIISFSNRKIVTNIDLKELKFLVDYSVDDNVKVIELVNYVKPEEFMNWVENVLKRIEDGEIFQVVLSRWLIYKISGNYISIVNKLHRRNPSPYIYYLKFQDNYVIGSSPELHVKVIENKVITRPIAGTRPRGRNEIEDKDLEIELLNSEKDFAEHIMLVDLARNDLGKICKPGSIKVTKFLVIEKYSHVQHLVSEVEGILNNGYDIIDVIKATFPAGTVSGTPKPGAMEIIYEFEKFERGPYAGITGIIMRNFAEFAITIRSIFIQKNLAKIQAGAGIVYDSKPYLEFLETEYKMKILKEVLNIETNSEQLTSCKNF